MKNKRIRFLGILLAAICLLCSCGRTVVEEEESGTWSHTVSVGGKEKNNLSSLSFPVECFTSLTNDELLARRREEQKTYDETMGMFLDTPLCIYGERRSRGNGETRYFAYDKRTGTFSDACRDPLCDHSTCLWGRGESLLSTIYCGADGLFFVITEVDETLYETGYDADFQYFQYYQTTIYATDFQGNNVEKLYETTGEVAWLTQAGEYLWFAMETWDEEQEAAVFRAMRLDLGSKRTETVLRNDETEFDWFYPMEDRLVYRNTADNGFGVMSFYLYDWETGETTLLLQDDDGSICSILGFQDNALYYCRRVREDNSATLYRRPDGGLGAEELTAELTNVKADFAAWSAGEFYWWERTDDGWILHREDQEPFVVTLSYEEEPVDVTLVYEKSGIVMDGDLLLCPYTVVDGFKIIPHWLMINLKTGEQLDFIKP